jgi:hypothetical protein
MRRTFLRAAGGVISLEEPEQITELPLSLVLSVFARYGKPLAAEILLTGPTLALSDSIKVLHLRHLARFDVIAKDYMVLLAEGSEPCAELATGITAALSFLASKGH